MRTVDLNSDLGEGYGPWRMGDDEAMLDVVSSANVACGFHAGDPLIMSAVVAAACRRGVAVGAHPGINDLWGFGRRRIAGDSPQDVAAMVVYQLGALRAIAARHGTVVRHLKLHGALSNAAAVDAALATAIAEAVAAVDPEVIWLVPAGSAMAVAGEAAGLAVRHEVFADRGYAADGTLLPRDRPGAVVAVADEVAERALRMVVEGSVVADDGSEVRLRADSVCVHGDTPDAVAAARAVRAVLEGAGVRVRALSFAPTAE